MQPSGLDSFVRAATKIGLRHDLPLVFVGSYEQLGQLETADPALVWKYIPRPFRTGNLKVIVDLALRQFQVKKQYPPDEPGLQDREQNSGN